jgi:hypothetical protein
MLTKHRRVHPEEMMISASFVHQGLYSSTKHNNRERRGGKQKK